MRYHVGVWAIPYYMDSKSRKLFEKTTYFWFSCILTSFWKINTTFLILKISLPNSHGTPWIGQILCPPNGRSMREKVFISKTEGPVCFEQHYIHIQSLNWIDQFKKKYFNFFYACADWEQISLKLHLEAI